MSVHEKDVNQRPDSDFIDGDLSLIVENNRCRLLDGRRTEGYIEEYFEDSAIFRWRITKYEDQGKYWDIPAEGIKNYQFEKDSKRLSDEEVLRIKEKITKFKEVIEVKVSEDDFQKTTLEVESAKESIILWLKNNSEFFKNNTIDFSQNKGPVSLMNDLKNYMLSIGFSKEEKLTSEQMVLNPSSGEWIKGLSITLAEMGLVSYLGKIPRSKDIFEGIGKKENRRKYLINRLAFIRAFFTMLNIKEVVVYRGMSSEDDWFDISRTFLPCTFSLDVAKDFASLEKDNKYRSSYIIKTTAKIEDLFMTYLETSQMNEQYLEAEVILLHRKKITI